MDAEKKKTQMTQHIPYNRFLTCLGLVNSNSAVVGISWD